MPAEPTSPRYSLRSRLLLLSGATFLVCAGIILMFFPLLNLTLEGALEGSTIMMEKASGDEADTIARLMVLEFSQMREIRQARPGDINEVDQAIMNLIWQKVTFNEVIKGIELIKGESDADGQRLTYSFYRQATTSPEPVKGPQKAMKRFVGPEGKLLDQINTPQTLEKDRLESSVYLGPKAEGQMLLRYLPVHILVPDEGAIFWGVAKIGVDISGLADIKNMLERERNQLRRTVWLAVILSLFIAGILAVSLLYLWARSLTEPLRLLSEAARDFLTGKPQDYDLWLNNLKRVDPRSQTEIFELKETLLRLGRAIPRLGERLFAGEPQACLTRVAARALPALLADSALLQQFRDQFRERRQQLAQAEHGRANPSPDDPTDDLDGALARLDTNLSDWGEFAAEPEKEWQSFELTPILQRAWRLATLGLSSPVRLASDLKALPRVWGAPGYLAQAVLMLLDYAAGVLPPDGRLTFEAGPLAAGGLQMTVAVSKPGFSGDECRALLSPPRGEADFTGSLGPALAAAIAHWHGGDLRAQPLEPEGLIFTLTLPPPPPGP